MNDLVGKKVNFNNQGTAAAYSGPLIFSDLGLDVQQTFIPHQPVQIAAATPAFGVGLAFRADPDPLFQSLPT
jgi:hypothetical protein